MRRRDLSQFLVGTVAGSALAARPAQAGSCVPPCFPLTPTETAGVIVSYEYPPGNVRRYGADNTGTTSSMTAFNRAISALPPAGGVIEVPDGKYLLDSTWVISKCARIVCASASASVGVNGGVTFIKSSGLSGDAIRFTADGSTIDGFTLDGQAGNVGDGIAISANNVTISHASIFRMGNDGLRIGIDGAGNCNSWRVDQVRCRENGRYGVHVHSNTGLAPDANAGVATNLEASSNVSHGVYVRNTLRNTFVGLLTEVNGGDGLRVDAPALENFFIGGDFSEGNASTDIRIASGAFRNVFVAPGVDGARFIDNGNGTVVLASNVALKLPSGHGAILSNGAGPGYVGNECFVALAGDANDRIRLGWRNAAPTTGLVPAQILADTSTLRVCSRDITGATVEIRAGSGIPAVAAFSASGIHAGASASAPFWRSGSGSPEGAIAAPVGSLYSRTDGGVGTALYVKQSGSGTTGWAPK